MTWFANKIITAVCDECRAKGEFTGRTDKDAQYWAKDRGWRFGKAKSCHCPLCAKFSAAVRFPPKIDLAPNPPSGVPYVLADYDHERGAYVAITKTLNLGHAQEILYSYRESGHLPATVKIQGD